VLVHNRKDMPGLPLAAEGDGIPSKGAKAKAAELGRAAGATPEEQGALVAAAAGLVGWLIIRPRITARTPRPAASGAGRRRAA
jgi:hypothetical protein